MANNAIMNAVYNNYLSTYMPRDFTSGHKNAHNKKNELKGIYNSIVKLNKDSPLYMMDTSKEAQRFAIRLKEGARSFQHTVASLGGIDEEAILNSKVAYSSDPAILNAKYIGDTTNTAESPSYSIEIKTLASPQTNLGNYLPANGHALRPDTYSFDIAINDLSYEFQYAVNDGDTNRDVQERLARLISNANIGIKADVLENDDGKTALQLQSIASGHPETNEHIFDISENQTSKKTGTVKTLGLHNIATLPCNAEFTVNGNPHSTQSNHFTLEKKYKLDLLAPTAENAPVTVGLKNDTDSLTENISMLIGSYNNFLKSAAEYLESQPNSAKLLKEMKSVATIHSNSLEPLGLSLQDNGFINLDNNLLTQSITEDNTAAFFSSVKSFTSSVLLKTEEVSLNPMDYVNRKIVAYKNPGHTFANPYVTSAYSGMMFNSYC